MEKQIQQFSDLADLFGQAAQDFRPGPVVGAQVEFFWKAQDNILKEAERFSMNWFARRHAATIAALETVRSLNGGATEPADSLRALAEWQKHSSERVTEDFREWFELVTRLAGLMVSTEVLAAEEILDETPETDVLETAENDMPV